MEKKLNCVLLLPLEEIALRKVVVMLWKQIDILNLFEVRTFVSFFDRDQHLREQQSNAENTVKSRLSKLMLPEPLLKKVICLLKPIGVEIIKWIAFYLKLLDTGRTDLNAYIDMPNLQYNSNLDIRVLEKIYFTSIGTVDYRKTAEELICHNMLDDVQRYKLASFYCLDTYLPRLWENLSEESKECFYDEAKLQLRLVKLELCWPYLLKEEKAKLDSRFRDSMPFYQRAFVSSAEEYNEAATQYFYQKLTLEERASLLFETARSVARRTMLLQNMSVSLSFKNSSGTLRYLLIQMIHEQQMELLKEFPVAVLNCFLQCPWHNLLLDTVELTWDFLPVESFYDLLLNLYNNIIILGCSNLDLFWKFFLRSRSAHKSYFIYRESLTGAILRNIFAAEDTDTLKFILRSMDAEDRARLVVSNRGLKTCLELVTEDKWHLLELFIREAMLSKEGRERLKENFRLHVSENYEAHVKCKIQELERFYELVDESPKSVSCKRSLEGEKEPDTKKLGSEE